MAYNESSFYSFFTSEACHSSTFTREACYYSIAILDCTRNLIEQFWREK